MVLQNKYKARASRRYNVARGGASDGRGRGGGGRGRGRGRQYTMDATSFPSLEGQAQENGARNGEDEDEDEDEEDNDEGEEEEEEEARAERAKYAPRKLTSNAWRFHPEEENNQDQDDDTKEESEPEVDLSAVLKHVANLDSSRSSKAISSEQRARDKLDAEAADIDVDLLPLMQRLKGRDDDGADADNVSTSRRPGQRAEPGKGNGSTSRFLAQSERRAPQRYALTDEQQRDLEKEGRRLQIEKERQEKHERRARILQQQAKTLSLDDTGTLKRTKANREGGAVSEHDRTAFLYTEEAEHQDNDEVDTFLKQLGTQDNDTREARQAAATSAAHSNLQAPPRARQLHGLRSAPPPRQTQTQTDEDFLDSVLS